MFWKTGVDITNDKSMFNFLHEHDFTEKKVNDEWYLVLKNSIVFKDHFIGFIDPEKIAAGETYTTLKEQMKKLGYQISMSLYKDRLDFELTHLGKKKFTDDLSPFILEYDYEVYKSVINKGYGPLKWARPELKEYTKVVRRFDTYCDWILEDVLRMSDKMEVEELKKTVKKFNNTYRTELVLHEIDPLTVSDWGRVDLRQLQESDLLFDCFITALKPILMNGLIKTKKFDSGYFYIYDPELYELEED